MVAPSDGGCRRALFLVHNFNDIDHMTPVIDALCGSGRWHVDMIYYPVATHGSINFDADWRVEYLRHAHGVRAVHIDSVDSSFQRSLKMLEFRNVLTSWCDKTPFLGRVAGRDIRGVLPWFLAWRYFDHLLHLFFILLSATGRNLMAFAAPDVVVIDWGHIHLPLHPLLRLASRQGIPVLQLPHGAWTYEGIYSHPSQRQDGKLNKRDNRLPFTRADVHVLDNLYKGLRSVAQGFEAGRMRFLGLARFSREWIDKLVAMPRNTAAMPASGRPKVVWFTAWLMACRRDGVNDCLDVLEEFSDRLDIVLKVHTRNPKNELADYGRLLRPGSGIQVIGNEMESFAMTRWADVVLITQSSIVYDAFIVGKPVFYLKNTLEYEMMWEVDGVGETVVDKETLRALLQAVADGTYRPSYSAAAIERYLRLAVWGGQPAEQVLPSYLDAFDQAVAGKPVVAGLSLDETRALWGREGRRYQQDEAGRNQ